MLLLYSGALAPNTDSNASQSLGGFISNTSLPNGSVGNLFSMITKSSVQQNTSECKLLVFKNDSNAALTGVKIYTVVADGAVYLIKLAFVLPAFDPGCNRYYFEQIQSPNQLPLQGTFNQYEGSANAIMEDDIQPGKYLGIWILRQITPAAIAANVVVKDGACDAASIAALKTQLEAGNSILVNDFNLIISWD